MIIVKLLTTSLADINALYENSGPFSRFLKGRGLDDILRSTKLKLRQRHTIVPHACTTSLLNSAWADGHCTSSALGLPYPDYRMPYPNFPMTIVGISMYVSPLHPTAAVKPVNHDPDATCQFHVDRALCRICACIACRMRTCEKPMKC